MSEEEGEEDPPLPAAAETVTTDLFGNGIALRDDDDDGSTLRARVDVRRRAAPLLRDPCVLTREDAISHSLSLSGACDEAARESREREKQKTENSKKK